MKKVVMFLVLSLLSLSVQAQSKPKPIFEVAASSLHFEPVDNYALWNGIHVYQGDKVLFDLGYPVVDSRKNSVGLISLSYEYIEKLAEKLTSYREKFSDDEKLIVDPNKFDEKNPTAFITLKTNEKVTASNKD